MSNHKKSENTDSTDRKAVVTLILVVMSILAVVKYK
jgi:hypothetical protein